MEKDKIDREEEEEENEYKISNWNGGPTKLPAKGGGQQQRPGKEEPLVGWRKEGATDLKPLAKQGGGEEKAEEVWVARL